MFYIITVIQQDLEPSSKRHEDMAQSLEAMRGEMLFTNALAITWTAYETHSEGDASWSYPIATFTACRGQIMHSTVPDVLLASDSFAALDRTPAGMKRLTGEEVVALQGAKIAFEIINPQGKPVAGALFNIRLDDMPVCAAIDFFQTRQRGIFEAQISKLIADQFPGHSFRLIGVNEARERHIYAADQALTANVLIHNRN